MKENEIKKTRLINALLTEPNIQKACECASVSESTAYRWLKEDSFKQELEEARERIINTTINYLSGNFTKCAKELMNIIDSDITPPQTKLSAIKVVFDSVGILQRNRELELRVEELENQKLLLSNIEAIPIMINNNVTE